MSKNIEPPGTNPRGIAEPCPTDLLTVAEVATYLRVCSRTVRTTIASKRLEAVTVGRQIRITRGALQKYLTSGGRR